MRIQNLILKQCLLFHANDLKWKSAGDLKWQKTDCITAH